MNKEIKKVAIFTILVLLACVFSTFNKSHAKYIKEERSLMYDITIDRLTVDRLTRVASLSNKNEYLIYIDYDRSNHLYSYINFEFLKSGHAKSGESDKYTYEITDSVCTKDSEIKTTGNRVTFSIKCDLSTIYDEENEKYDLPLINIYENINNEGRFKYTDILANIFKADYNPEEKPYSNISGNTLTIHKDYTDFDNHSIKYFVRDFVLKYMNEEYSSNLYNITEYFDYMYQNDDDIFTNNLYGLTRSLDSDVYTFTIDPNLLNTIAKNYHYYTNYSSNPSTKRIINLGETLESYTDIFAQSLKYYFSDAECTDIINYLNYNGGLNNLISGNTIPGFSYVSSSKNIYLTDNILDLVNFNGNTVILQMQDAGLVFQNYYNFIQASKYNTDSLTIAKLSYDVRSYIGKESGKTHIHFFRTDDYAALLTSVSTTDDVTLTVSDTTESTKSYVITNAVFTKPCSYTGAITGMIDGEEISFHFIGLTELSSISQNGYSIVVEGNETDGYTVTITLEVK